MVSKPQFRLGYKRSYGTCATAWKCPERDYLQIFHLSCDGDHQRIEHAQEQPEYQHVVVIPGEQPVDAKVYIIEDPDHVTMLLADEY